MYVKAIAALAVAVTLVLASAAVALADAVTDWNGYATTVIVTNERQLPQVSPLHYAMVQGAVYDAVNAIEPIDRRYQPYLVPPAATPWDLRTPPPRPRPSACSWRSSPISYPRCSRSTTPRSRRSPKGLPRRGHRGGRGGGRGDDRRARGRRPGRQRPGPDRLCARRVEADAARLPARSGTVAARRAPVPRPARGHVPLDGPNALTSTTYAEDFDEVKRVGSATSTIRTADQTDAARFWQTNGPGLFNGVMNTLAADPQRGSAPPTAPVSLRWRTWQWLTARSPAGRTSTTGDSGVP